MRPETRQALLEAGAESIDAGGNRPIRLDAAFSWWVDTGRVEIFALRTDPGARGPRTHVATLDAGQVAFGMEARREARLPFGRVETRDAKAALLAIGLPDTKLLKLPLTALVRLAQNPEHVPDLASAIEEWLSALFQQVPRSGAPKKFEALRRNSEVTLESEGEASRTASGVVWVRHVEGSSRFLGREELAMKPAGHLLPLSDETWMVSAEPAVLSCVGTGKLVRSGTVWESLARFHELFLEYVEMQVAVERDEERDRLERKLDLDRETLATASRRLASVLDDRGELGELRGAAAGGDTEPLVDACQLVGDVLGIEFTAPEEDQGTGGHRYFLSRVCAYSRVRHRLVMLRGEWWSLDNGPLLAFRRDPEADERSRLAGHPVALLPKSAESYEIVDPATGERTPATAETAESLEAEAFMFYPPLPERPLKIRDLVSLAARGRRRDLVTLLLMGMGAGLLGLLVPILTGQIFGVVIPSAERSQLWQMTVALGAAAFASLAFQLTRSIAVLRVSGKLDGTLQAAVWDRLLALPAGFFRQFSVGDLAARSMGIDHIRGLLLGNVTTSLLGAVFSVFSFALLFYYSARLALVATLMVGILLAFTGVLVFFQVKHQRVLLALEGKVSSLLFGLLNGLSKLRVAGAEARGYALWAERYTEQRQRTLATQRLANLQLAFNAAYGLLTTLVLFAVMGLALEENLSVSQFLAFSAAFGQFQTAALSLIGLFSGVLTIVPLYERVQPILETPPEVDEAKSAVAELSGDVEMSHVSFRYTSDGPLILDDVSIRARPGEFIALVGPSGSGKSTSMRLLLGFEQPDAGSIYFDGQDLPSLDVQSVRRQMGVVLQNGRPIAGDIFTNIVGTSNLGIDDAWEAARQAGLDEDIKSMPMGMHTVVSEGAGTFSGGQIQRLMIARAIVNRPRILIFDEATSALDNRTQDIVSRSLEGLKATRIVIAHRLSTIRNADRIYVLVKGRVEEAGSYEELMAMDGVFARLAERQIA